MCYLQRKKTFRGQGLRVYVFKSVGEQSRKRMSGNCLVGKCFDTRKNRTGILVDTSLGHSDAHLLLRFQYMFVTF